MPRAKPRAPSAEVVEPPASEADGPGAQQLAFNESLTWRPGKPIPVTDLLRRLRTLSEELESIDQEDADRSTLAPKAQELANTQLLHHKDKGVQAYTLLCIVEMFRLLAPNAPYKGGQLREIFDLFASTIVPALADTSDPYSQQHNAILSSLTGVKSIILITDIPGSDVLVLNLFTNCFDVMSGVSRPDQDMKLPKNLEYNMANMFCTLVDECENLPSGVVDIILAQFLRADPNAMVPAGKKGAPKPSPVVMEVSPAYNIARAICNTCANKMSRNIGQYFASVLIDASETVATTKSGKSRGKKRGRDESDDESDDGLLTPPAEDDLVEVEKAHRLLRELWRSAPDVITNIVAQVETEVEAESPHLRRMAVQTIGDMIAGIGAAGPPLPTPLDPAAYPSQSLENSPRTQQQNDLLEPNAPHAFSSVYPTTYLRFMERVKDKAAEVRSAWATAAGRIISTSAGGKGLDDDQEMLLLNSISRLLMDNDERVRLAAVQAIALCDFNTITDRLGKAGSVVTPGSVLCNLADRIKDPKQHVRLAAMQLLSGIWGVAAGAITEGSERLRDLLGSIPSKIFEATYTNNREIHALVSRFLFDSLLPLAYPPIKSKHGGKDEPQRVNDSQLPADEPPDADALRAERILVLVRDLEERAKMVFFKLQERRAAIARFLDLYLKACETVYGNEKDTKDKESKKDLEKLIGSLANLAADTNVASEHLSKFAKHHDRRSYQLIRFCYDPASDYRKIIKAIRELTKRLEDAPAGIAVLLETLTPLVRSAAMLVYNRSHVPTIVEVSRTNQKGLGSAAHDVLKEISTHAPNIFEIHVHELCELLKTQIPSAGVPVDASILDTLKACAAFARRFPKGMPKDRDFYKAMVSFAIHGTPPKAAKYATTVIVSSADKKEMYIKEIQKACIQHFKYGEPGFLTQLAAVSQLKLLANSACADLDDNIMDIAIQQVLLQERSVADDSDPLWSHEADGDISAKLWALRILVNGLRGSEFNDNSEAAITEAAERVYKLLNTLIKEGGGLSKTGSTPRHHRAQLRLAAAVQLLKLSCNHKLDRFLTAADFNRLSTIAQDSIPEIRAGFVKALKKYLGNGTLPNRFYALVFLYAFEPTKETLQSTSTWLKSRAALSAKRNDTVMEGAFARLLSLLAHHPDFSQDADELEDFVEYIMFYLKNAATESNLPVIHHIAQRLKQVQDGIDPAKSENLYILSDIAEMTIRQFADIKGWSLQLMSGRLPLPSGLFSKMPSHTVAQETAGTKYIPEALDENLEGLVKNSLRPKKRKSDGSSSQAAKKAKASRASVETKRLPVRKAAKPTPKKAPAADKDGTPSMERRKSGRTSSAKNYAENNDSDDEEIPQQKQEEEEDEVDEQEARESSTPPTSDPAPIPPSAEKKTAKQTRGKKAAASKLQSPMAFKEKAVPARRGRSTRAKKEKDVMDFPSDSD